MIERILVVDDEPLMLSFLAEALKRQSYEVDLAENGKRALTLLRSRSYDLLISDMKMPEISGLELLRKAKELSPSLAVIMMTAFGTIESAVEAMRLGAYTYLLKPFTLDVIEATLEKVKEHLMLVKENTFLREEGKKQSKIIAQSPKMQKILSEAVRVAKTQASVLITGESGTGKEVVAGAIHKHSLRSNRPYIRVNCAAVPETLIESEFFGHEKGAFTGANSKRLGRFELADGGTLLLDEVTEIPITLQPKLLRVLQEQEFERVGGTKPLSVDVRIIATSNRNLLEAIEQKFFREDLFYRLNVVPLHLPPLRERREDILPLAYYFLEKHCCENHKKSKRFSKEAEEKLSAYPWPGNIRELSNIIERVVVLDYGEIVQPEELVLDFVTQVPEKW